MTLDGLPEGLEVDEAQLIQDLQTKGLDDPTTQELLCRWTDQVEAEADEVARKGELAEQARTDLEIRKALLYTKAGLYSIAVEAWTAAHMRAGAQAKVATRLIGLDPETKANLLGGIDEAVDNLDPREAHQMTLAIEKVEDLLRQ